MAQQGVRGVVRRPVRVALVAIIAAAAALVGATPARVAAAGARTLTVSPATGLENQVVEVSWTGFTPSVDFFPTVTILQCAASPKSIPTSCYTAAPFPSSEGGNQVNGALTGADGTGHAFIEVRPSLELPSLGCSDKKPCSLVAFEDDGSGIPTTSLPPKSASAQITFAKTPRDCPSVGTFDFQSEGEASATGAVTDWAANLCNASTPDVVSYTETSSNRARTDLIQGLVDVGFTSLPARKNELASAPAHARYLYAPVDMTAVAVAYHMTDAVTNEPITGLAATPRLIARLITGSDVVGWDADPDFTSRNPAAHNYPVNHTAFPLLRNDANADTWLVTDWLASDAATKNFLAGNDTVGHVAVDSYWKNFHYPVDQFQNLDHVLFDAGYQTLGSTADVAHHLFYSASAVNNSASDPNWEYVGVLDLATARRWELPVLALVNASGHAVAPDAASVAAGYAAMTHNADGTRVANVATTTPNAYPLVKIDYAMVPATYATKAKADAVRHFLEYAAGAGQDNLPPGYTKLSPDLAQQTLAVAKSLTVTPAKAPPPSTAPGTHTAGGGAPTTAAPAATSFDPNGTGSGFGGSEAAGGETASAGDSGGGTTAVAAGRAAQKARAHHATRSSATTVIAERVVHLTRAGAVFALPVITILALLAMLASAGIKLSPRVARVVHVRTSLPLPHKPPPELGP